MSDQLCRQMMYLCFAMAGVLLGHGFAQQQAKATVESDTTAYRGSGRFELQVRR